MAFDQTTRNKLQNFVSQARNLLSKEFTRQLQNDYGIDPETGSISELDSLTHLDDAKFETARLLRDTYAHYLQSNTNSSPKDVLDRIVREQAFTVLNRICAIRMAEARNIIIESIAGGYNSKGFQLYSRLAGTALGEKGDVYRSYIYSIYDEFAVDLAVLFDRFSPTGRLFPKESVLLDLLSLVNDAEISGLWSEDETIGWIYQYFNSIEERKKMRAESQAPRNSRELAVRNQFFTPRYVVEFLTDNTLGRIWYEMTQGNTSLKETCLYLVRRPNEIFLKENEPVPQQAESNEELTQEELLKRSVHITFRPLKDPRIIRMLDPACGSMHFGLYSFDLFEHIYKEAWDLEVEKGANVFTREGEQIPLTNTYKTKEELIRDIPRLIIENNIHGIDIDPRAVQIAGLSLWLRAQKNWNDQKIKNSDRPVIRKGNIVCAEPMPGEVDMLKEFASSLKPRVLGQLLEQIFDKMKLAGEAGSLLKIEEEIQETVDKAREEFSKELLQRKSQEEFLPGVDMGREITLFDFTDLPDKTKFWDTAEDSIIKALKDYAEHSETQSSLRHRLFAEDAAKGFAFIDICRKRYDVVLMNPPFGEYPYSYREIASSEYTSGSHDIIAGFIERTISFKNLNGLIGCISSRAVFFGSTNSRWRELVIIPNGLRIWSELGTGVLDDAVVETCIYIIGVNNSNTSIFIRPKKDNNTYDFSSFLDTQNYYYVDINNFNLLKGSPFAYWLDNHFYKCLKELDSFEQNGIKVRVGLQTSDDFRFVKLWYEVSQTDINNKWFSHAKGGDNNPYYTDIHLLVNWINNGKEIKSISSSVARNSNYYCIPGLTFSYRTNRFSPAIMPADTITGVAGMGIFIQNYEDLFKIVSILNSSIINSFIEARLGQFEGGALYQAGTVSPTPLANFNYNDCNYFSERGKTIYNILRLFLCSNENSRYYTPILLKNKSISIISENDNNTRTEIFSTIMKSFDDLDNKILHVYGFKGKQCDEIKNSGRKKFNYALSNMLNENIYNAYDLTSYLLGSIMGRWDIRFATGEKTPPELPDPFAPLPVCPPGMLQNKEGLPAEPKDVPSSYPLRITWSGIIVDDESHKEDIVKRIREAIEVIWKDKSSDIEHEAFEILGVKSLRDYFQNPNNFFAQHLKRYSKSRRQAPIYWPLSTSSGSYTLWLYYHRLTDQTLFTCVNDFVEPKIKQVNETVESLKQKNNRNKQEENELEKLSNLFAELKDFREELLRLAKFWKPNLNDGVQITAAPLWKLFKLRAWQKTLKETWEKLEKGDYDWAHLAYSIWPDRVSAKCKDDKSLAIAHDLEHLYVETPAKAKKKRTKKQVTADFDEDMPGDDE